MYWLTYTSTSRNGKTLYWRLAGLSFDDRAAVIDRLESRGIAYQIGTVEQV